MGYLSLTDADRAEMLAAIGVSSVDELFDQVPPGVRFDRALDVLPALQPLREVTAEISDWQTFPQLYVKGELIGGADIVEEMFESGELAEALGVEQPEVAQASPAAPAQSPPLQIDGS